MVSKSSCATSGKPREMARSPAASGTAASRSSKSALCTIFARSRSAGSSGRCSCTRASKEQRPRSSWCGYRAPGASKPIAPVRRSTSSTSAGSTKVKVASGSMKRRISHAVAVRFTRIWRRVTHCTVAPPVTERPKRRPSAPTRKPRPEDKHGLRDLSRGQEEQQRHERDEDRRQVLERPPTQDHSRTSDRPRGGRRDAVHERPHLPVPRYPVEVRSDEHH